MAPSWRLGRCQCRVSAEARAASTAAGPLATPGEIPHRDPAKRHGHLLGIAVELREARYPKIGPPVHTIDDGEGR